MLDFKARMKNYNAIFKWTDKENTWLNAVQELSKSNLSLETRLKLIDKLNEKIVIAKKGKQMLLDYKIE